MLRGVFGLPGLTSRAISLACGTNSDSSSTILGNSSTARKLTPVRLAPGRARLATKPGSTASPTLKTIGIVEVALFAASAEGTEVATIASTLRATSRRRMRAADHTRDWPAVFDRDVLC